MSNVSKFENINVKIQSKMKTIKDIKLRIMAAMLLAGLAFNACERRELEDDSTLSALIPVRIDWSLSGVSVEEMHRASVWLFPHNGKTPLEYHLEIDLTSREIAVPVGVYSVLVFNETTEANDWEGIAFTGTNSYETFAAVAVSESTRGFYTRSEELPLVGNPDAIAAWSLDRFEVTHEMVNRTRTLNMAALEDEVPHLTVIQPLPRFERVVVTAYVTNLKSSKQATGTIDGMSSGVYMVSGERISKPAVQAFILGERVYDGNNGTTSRTFNIFGRLNEAKHNVAIDFLLTNNELHPREEFDVTNLIVTETVEHVRTHIINLGYSNLDGDHHIELPEGDMESSITVDSWEEVIIPLK